MRRNFLLALVGMLFASVSIAQEVENRSLDVIRERLEVESLERRERITNYLQKTGKSLFFIDHGRTYAIKDIDTNGNPIYVSTHNVGAALTTGADKLRAGGDLGLALDGSGVKIGIWDGGSVRETHQELENRITISDGGSEYNFHATHVAGTILASGVNNGAKGMAVNGKAFTFDFIDDDVEMANRIAEDQSGLILSNHSYGAVTGWNNGTWYGDSEISDIEDYRFGFYTGGARLWDEFAFNSPYYTIVKSAGNDRGDSGSGPHPPDGPYDIVSSEATAKNIITIGAVNKVSDYQDATSVVMSSFSSWGPTDDGRIKPDFVAAGVSLYSSFEDSDQSYGTLSGTSMSAPNATGSFALLQQLYASLNGGNFMKSAHLKGLITHTVKEAGIADGPDYKFGWGLIDVEAAAKFMIKENDYNHVHQEIILQDQEEFILNFTPQSGTKVVATICWTDLPGTVPQASLDPKDTILVNDLDLRITSSNGETEEPWILSPDRPGAGATKGDNFRDNTEKIEFIADGSDLTVRLNHKGQLEGGEQVVHLLLSYEVDTEPELLYWTGTTSGDWNEPSNWSEQSNGNPASTVPSNHTTVIFENVFEGQTALQLNQDVEIGSFVYLGQTTGSVDLNSFNMTVNGNFSANENINFIGLGKLNFKGENSQSHKVISPGNALSDVTVVFDDSQSTWKLLGDAHLGDVELHNGTLILEDSELTLRSLDASMEGVKSLHINNSIVSVNGDVNFENLSEFGDQGTSWLVPEGSVVDFTTNRNHLSSIMVEGNLTMLGSSGSFESVSNKNNLTFNVNFTVDSLLLYGGSSTLLADNVSLEIVDLTVSETSEGNIAELKSNTMAEITIMGHKKICVEFVNVENVTKTGEAAVSLGENGSAINSDGWSLKTCDNVLFADFELSYLCDGSITYFENKSSGEIDSYAWSVDDEVFSSESEPFYEFKSSGTYIVKLEIADSEEVISYSEEVTVSEGIDKVHSIIENKTSLASNLSADSYQWFKNNDLLAGETNRTFVHNSAPGVYRVVAFIDDCNIASEEYEKIVLGLDEQELFVYPNPVKDFIEIRQIDILKQASIKFISVDGKQVFPQLIESSNHKLIFNFTGISEGIYVLKINDLENSEDIKIIVRK
ncbi:S8 family serine peptidase [Ekhidna sp.]|uniref:S8 family serine peptidase n=1 Tax=Ekhidna sp. TaxID=2608089 RepID=UPI0032EDE071